MAAARAAPAIAQPTRREDQATHGVEAFRGRARAVVFMSSSRRFVAAER